MVQTWECHRCRNQYDEVDPRCSSCGHYKCGFCSRFRTQAGMRHTIASVWPLIIPAVHGPYGYGDQPGTFSNYPTGQSSNPSSVYFSPSAVIEAPRRPYTNPFFGRDDQADGYPSAGLYGQTAPPVTTYGPSSATTSYTPVHEAPPTFRSTLDQTTAHMYRHTAFTASIVPFGQPASSLAQNPSTGNEASLQAQAVHRAPDPGTSAEAYAAQVYISRYGDGNMQDGDGGRNRRPQRRGA